MHHTQGPGTIRLMDGAQGANRLSVPEHTQKYNADIQYSRLLQRCSASLDLEAIFKHIKISDDNKPEVCTKCHTDRCRCPAFMPGMPCLSALPMPTNTDNGNEQITDLVKNKPLHVLHLPVQSPCNEEADREVAAICRAPEYYQVKSQVTRRHKYYIYNTLDSFKQTSKQKR